MLDKPSGTWYDAGMNFTVEELSDEFAGAVFNHASAGLGIPAYQAVMTKHRDLFATAIWGALMTPSSSHNRAAVITQSLADASKVNCLPLRAVDFQGTVRILLDRIDHIN